MADSCSENLVKAFYIALKDAKVYYFKASNFTYALLIPISLFLAFSIAGNINSSLIVAGLASLVILFGSTSIEAVSVVLERQTGTFNRLLVAPVSFFAIVFGKALAGFFFGLILAGIIIFPLSWFSDVVLNPVLAIVAIAFASMAFSALGIVTSAYAKWVPEAQMVSNFFRFPMVFLAGTFTPLETYPFQLQVVARFLPLTYSVEALQNSIVSTTFSNIYLIDIAALFVFTIIFLFAGTLILKRRIA